MKKALSLVLALVMCLSLCACGHGNGGVPSKDDLLASVEAFSLSKFRNDCNANLLRAKDTYIGKVYKISGIVEEIKEDCCVFDSDVVVPLSKDTLMSLSVGDCISVVGRVGDVTHEEETLQIGLGTNTIIRNILTMDVAYYLGDTNMFRAEVVSMATNGGLVMLLDDFHGRYCGIEISLTQDEVDQFKRGDIVQIEGRIIKTSNQHYEIYDNHYDAYLKIYGATIK